MKAVGLGLAMAVCVSVVFGLPQLRYFADGHRQALIQNGDEMAYAAKLRDALDGHWRAASPYAWEYKDGPALPPYGGEMFLAGLGRLTGLDLDGLIVLTRFLAPAGAAFLLVRLLLALTGSAGWAALGAGLVLLEPGTYYYKPVYYLTGLVAGWPPRPEMPLLYSRFLNPLLLIVPFLVAALFLFRALAGSRKADVGVAGLAVGLSFLAGAYYGTYLVVWLGFLLLFLRHDAARRRRLLAVAVLGLAVGGYWIAENAVKFGDQGVEVLTRFGGNLESRAPFNLLHKGLLACGLAFALFFRDKRSLAYRFLLSGMVAGYVLLNQNLLTGREVLGYHYHYPNAAVAVSALVALARDRLPAVVPNLSAARWTVACRVGGLALAAWLVVNGLVVQSLSYGDHQRAGLPWDGGYPSTAKEWFPRTLTWINANTPRDAVILADPDLSFVIPVYTHANVFLNPRLGDDAVAAMPDEELFERYMVHLKLRGATPAEVFDLVRFRPAPLLGWKFGRNMALKEKYDLTVSATFARILETDRLARDYVSAFEAFAPQELDRGLARYRLDYLVVSDNDRRFRTTAPARFPAGTLSRVAAIPGEGVEIFRIARPAGGR